MDEVAVVQRAETLTVVALPRAGLRTDAVLVALAAGLIAASAQFSIALPFTPVPIAGQTFSVLLIGASLGTLRGGRARSCTSLPGSPPWGQC